MKKDNSDTNKKRNTSKIRSEDQGMGNSKKKSSKTNLQDALHTELNAKNELREESNKLQAIIDAMPAVIGCINTDYRFKYANKFLKNLLNVDPNKIIGQHIKDILGEKGFTLVKPKYDRAFAGERQDFEMVIPMPNGRLTPIQATYVPQKVNGSVAGVFIFIQDISKRKRDEKELDDVKTELEKTNLELKKAVEVSAIQFNLFANNLPGNVFIKDDNLKYIFFNQNSLNVFNLKEKSIKNLTVHDLYSKSVANKLNDVDLGVQLKKQIVEKEIKTIDINNIEKWERVIKFPIQMPDGKVFVGGMALDITQERQRSQEILNSEIKYRSLFESARDGIFILDKGKIIDCNQSILDIFGYKEKSELLNKTIFDISPEKQPNGQFSIELGKKLINRTSAGESPLIIWEHIKKDGTQFFAEVSGNQLVYGDKQFLLNSVRDITQRIATENELQKRQDEIIEGQNLANFGNWSWDFQNGEIKFSDVIYRIYGLELNTPLNYETVTKIIHPDDFENHKNEIELWVKNKKVTPYEYRIVHADGSIRHIYGVGRIEFDKKGEPVRLYGTLQDVTVQKEAECKLQEAKVKAETSERYLNNILNNIGDPIFVKDEQSRIIDVNDAFCILFDLAREKIIGKTLAEDVSPSELDHFLRIDKQVIKTGKESVVEESLTIRGGETRIISTRKTRYIDSNNKKHIIGVIRDITERINYEKKILESKSKFEILTDVTFEGILIHDNGVPFDLNNSLPKMFGYTKDEFLNKDLVKLIVRKEDQNLILKNIKNEYQLPYEVIGVKKDGSEFPIEIEGKTYISKEDKKYRVTAIRDITERKIAKEKLIKSEQLFRGLTANAPVAIYKTDKDGSCNYVNEAWIEYSGLSFNESMGYGWSSAIHPEDRDRIVKEWQKSILTDDLLFSEYRLVHKNGKIAWLSSKSVALFDANNELYGYIGTLIDITERKKAEEEIKQTLSQLNLAVKTAKLGVWSRDVETDELIWNDRLFEIYGSSPDEFESNMDSYFDRLHPDDLDYINEVLGSLYEGEPLNDVKFRIITPDNEIRYIDSSAAPLEVNGRIEKYIGINRDITEQKIAEENLKEAFTQLNLAVDTAKLGVWTHTIETGELIWNSELFKIFGINQSEFDYSGDAFKKLVHPEDLAYVLEKHDASGQNKLGTSLEFRIVRPNSEVRYIYATVSPVFDEEGNLTKTIGINLDITERKTSELEIKRALNEITELKLKIEAENVYLKEELKLEGKFEEIIGSSKSLVKILKQVEQVAKTDSTVFVLGETGTGKELIAKAIHKASNRKDKPLVKVNCSALPAELIESELFGHEKGAFTGAINRKIGRFELANNGTIFLDEIGDIPIELQTRLLRVLQESEFERVGGESTIKVDVRLITATNRNLEELVIEGKFRQDLYYRLNVFPITSPPLRERIEDIPSLVNHFVLKYNHKVNNKIKSIDNKSIEKLMRYDWPGNIRELEHVIERAIILNQGEKLRLGSWFVKEGAKISLPNKLRTLEELERHHITKVLEKTNWKIRGINGAAEILGLKPTTLESRIKKLKINKVL